MQGKQALFTNLVVEQATEDRRKGTRLVTLKKRVHIFNYIVSYGVGKSTCLTTQEHLHHAWGITDMVLPKIPIAPCNCQMMG